VLAHTVQHDVDNMSHVSFAELDIPHPDYHLGIGGGSHARTPIVVTAHNPFTFALKRRVQDMPRTQPAAATGPGSTQGLVWTPPTQFLGETRRNLPGDAERLGSDRPAAARPSLPLTHNAAERLLRHWVIARRLNFATRCEQGTRAFALLARLINTCRARKASAWDYLSAALQAVRQGIPMPPLTAVVVGG
jgi:hypothetical protein